MTENETIRIYADTSVFGGVFDEEFEEAIKLQQAYTEAKILSVKYSTDALHVALATISQSSLIVSWNFKHIVNFQKIPRYNAVNKLNGYKEIAIYSPLEVIEYED